MSAEVGDYVLTEKKTSKNYAQKHTYHVHFFPHFLDKNWNADAVLLHFNISI